MPTPTQIQSTTQQFLDIYDITNDIVIMKDGACSLIMMVNALNFGLLAEEEQDGIMYAYAGLLNSLNYPIQIVIRSQTKDATNYLNLLREQESKASTELKKSQIRAYAGFVADLIRERNVLDKKFYIVIPANNLEMGLLPPSTVIPGVKQVDISTVERSVILDKAKTILEPKRDQLLSQFNRIGLYGRQLNTQEIIQLFYTSYNPEAAEGQQITNSNDYTTPLVTGQIAMAEVPMPTIVPTPAQELVEVVPQPVVQESEVVAAPQTLTPSPVEAPTLTAPVVSASPTVEVTPAPLETVPLTPAPVTAPPATTTFDITSPPTAPATTLSTPTQIFDSAQLPVPTPPITAVGTSFSPAPIPQATPDAELNQLQSIIDVTADQVGTNLNPVSIPTPAQTDNLPPLPEI